ncbi:MAG: hypothetical protein P1V20_00930 [Verrucomicrobiales bacterium]|nr:hypothetical protein [Verrucomicrobiales bacterium]
MDRDKAIEEIEGSCRIIALEMMKLTPKAKFLENEEIAGEVMKASYELTIQLEIIKKKLIQLKGRDDSGEL